MNEYNLESLPAKRRTFLRLARTCCDGACR
jgi:hypothetical protein